jgi:hypothetical protein
MLPDMQHNSAKVMEESLSKATVAGALGSMVGAQVRPIVLYALLQGI